MRLPGGCEVQGDNVLHQRGSVGNVVRSPVVQQKGIHATLLQIPPSRDRELSPMERRPRSNEEAQLVRTPPIPHNMAKADYAQAKAEDRPQDESNSGYRQRCIRDAPIGFGDS